MRPLAYLGECSVNLLGAESLGLRGCFAAIPRGRQSASIRQDVMATVATDCSFGALVRLQPILIVAAPAPLVALAVQVQFELLAVVIADLVAIASIAALVPLEALVAQVPLE